MSTLILYARTRTREEGERILFDYRLKTGLGGKVVTQAIGYNVYVYKPKKNIKPRTGFGIFGA